MLQIGITIGLIALIGGLIKLIFFNNKFEGLLRKDGKIVPDRELFD